MSRSRLPHSSAFCGPLKRLAGRVHEVLGDVDLLNAPCGGLVRCGALTVADRPATEAALEEVGEVVEQPRPPNPPVPWPALGAAANLGEDGPTPPAAGS